MSGVFISYRREDTAGEAAHLAEDLADELGTPEVFIDIDAIAPGVDFAQQIDHSLHACDLVLVLIGHRWLTARGSEEGTPRIQGEDDFVRMEVGKALARADVQVIPVLVEGAQMPPETALPPDIAPLTKINALQLSNSRWRYDVGQILNIVRRGGVRGAVRRLPSAVRIGVPVLALLAAGALIAAIASGGGGGGGGGDSQRIVLPPASVPPVVDECTKPLLHAVDRTVGPLTCQGGELNQLAWQYYSAQFDSLTMSLGPSVTPEQVGHALCTDLDGPDATFPIVSEIYQISQIYYGWNFGIDPRPEGAGGTSSC